MENKVEWTHSLEIEWLHKETGQTGTYEFKNLTWETCKKLLKQIE